MCVRVFMYMYVYIYVRTHTHAYTFIRTHTIVYTHTDFHTKIYLVELIVCLNTASLTLSPSLSSIRMFIKKIYLYIHASVFACICIYKREEETGTQTDEQTDGQTERKKVGKSERRPRMVRI